MGLFFDSSQGTVRVSQFFPSHLDYIFLIYGLSFLLTAAQCMALQGRNPSLPWRLLAAFGLFHGVNERLDAVALSVPDSNVVRSPQVSA